MAPTTGCRSPFPSLVAVPMPACLPWIPPITNAIQVMDEHRRAMLAVATALYDRLYRLAKLGPAARIAQRAYRAHMGRGLLALSKHQVRTTDGKATSPQSIVFVGILYTWGLPTAHETTCPHKPSPSVRVLGNVYDGMIIPDQRANKSMEEIAPCTQSFFV